jgi:hypothetical protein
MSAVSVSVQIPASIKGDTDGTYLGAQDYPNASLDVDTHQAQGAAGDATCTLFGGGPKTPFDLLITAVNTKEMSFKLTGSVVGTGPTAGVISGRAVSAPRQYVLTARACNIFRQHGDAALPYGQDVWLDDNLVACTK